MTMATRSETEVRELIESEPFNTWYRRYKQLRRAIATARDEQDTLRLQVEVAALQAEYGQRIAEETLFAAGERSDQATAATAEVATIENLAYEELSQFEQERRVSTRCWTERDRLEKHLEDQREQAEELQRRLEFAQRASTPAGIAEAERLQIRIRDLGAAIERDAKAADQARLRLEEADARKVVLWNRVQHEWLRSFRADLARSEYAYQARRTQHEAEAMFEQSQAERKRSDNIQRQIEILAEHQKASQVQYTACLKQAEVDFGCLLIEEFMFWMRPDDVETIWCVPLVDVNEHLAVSVRALHIYQVTREQGIDQIEPAQVSTSEPHSTGRAGVWTTA